eukprot:5399458-Prymnesium_polylepis.3
MPRRYSAAPRSTRHIPDAADQRHPPRGKLRTARRTNEHHIFRCNTTFPDPCMTDPRAVPAPAWSKTSAWDPVRVVRTSRTRAMFVSRVLVAR